MRSLIAAVLVLVPAINAHFTVAYPPTLGAFKDDEEGNAPCGGYTPNLATDATTDFHVGGDAIGTVSTHPQSNWLYRVTTDSAGAGNWTQIYPIVQQSGLGSFCVPKVSVSDSWIGKKAVLSIVSNAPDGLLYQCSAISFVAGTGSTPGACKNVSSVSASFTSDSALTALVGTTATSPSSTSSSPSSSNTASTSPSATRNAAPAGPVSFSLLGVEALLTTGAMFLLGGLLL